MLRQIFAALLALILSLLLPFNTIAAEWTVMVYIGADNNLSGYVNGDVDEMERAGSTSEVNIICQIDGKASYGGYNDYLGTWSTVRRYRIQSGNSSNNRIDAGFIADLGDLNSENPNVLRDFAIWAIDNYPAERYMLVLWNHGGGWARPSPEPFKAIIWDDTNGDGSGIGFSNGEYANMMSQICDHLGKTINVVGFDACIVGMLEIEYETMGYADYLVHSEANVPGQGWDYDFLVSLTANPYCTEEELINWIIDEYATYYTSSSVTMSGVRLDHDHNDYQMAVANFARELILAGGKSNTNVTNAITAARDWGSNLVDVYDFANQIDSRNIGGAGSAVDLAAQALKAAQGYPIPAPGKPLVRSHQNGYSGAAGIMGYIPTGTASSSWSNLDITECNIWSEFINSSTSLPAVKLAYWGNTGGKYIETGSTVNLYVNARNLGSGTATSVSATLSSWHPAVTIIGNTSTFANISAGAVVTAGVPFQVYISPAVGESVFVPFELTFNTGKKAKFVLTALGEVNYPPETAVLIGPYNYARWQHGMPTLTWAVPNDPDGDNLHFEVQWANNPNFTSAITIDSESNSTGFGPIVPRLSGTGNCNYTVNSQGEGAMTNGATYWWRVRAKDSFHSGPWSLPRSITIDNGLTTYDWHQTTDAQFLVSDITDLGVEDNYVFLQGAVTLIDDDMEYASESEAWAVWNTYDGGSNIEITLEDRRQVSGTYSLRVRDRNTSAYAGAWQTFEPITKGTMRCYAKIFGPSSGDAMEFIGLHNGSAYTSSFTTGLVVYGKADTLKFWDGTGRVVHTSMDSLWHLYEIEFDLEANTSVLYVDGVWRGSWSAGGLSQITMFSVGTKLLGNSIQGTAYWDDFLLISNQDADSGVITGQPVAHSWHPTGTDNWGHVKWTQNVGDSIKVTVLSKSGSGPWSVFSSAFTMGTSGEIDISPLGTVDSVRVKATLYHREGHDMPVLYDWTVDWNEGSVFTEESINKPTGFELYSNWPNPFNPATTISFHIPENGPVEVAVFNVHGDMVFYEETYRPSGQHFVRFDGSKLSSGTYFARVRTSTESRETKMVLLK
jgi:hypothetical protein